MVIAANDDLNVWDIRPSWLKQARLGWDCLFSKQEGVYYAACCWESCFLLILVDMAVILLDFLL